MNSFLHLSMHDQNVARLTWSGQASAMSPLSPIGDHASAASAWGSIEGLLAMCSMQRGIGSSCALTSLCGWQVCVVAHKRLQHAVWLGGSLLGRSSGFPASCTTREAYAETGSMHAGKGLLWDMA